MSELTNIERQVEEIRLDGRKHSQVRRRIELLMRVVPQQELASARDELTAPEIEEMFNISSYERQLLFAWYKLSPYKSGHHKALTELLPPEPVRTALDPEQFADMVVRLAAERLEAVLESKVKMAVARALHEAAERIAE